MTVHYIDIKCNTRTVRSKKGVFYREVSAIFCPLQRGFVITSQFHGYKDMPMLSSIVRLESAI